MTPQSLTTGEAAKQLGIAQHTVIKWCDDGTLHSFKVGTHRRIPVSEIERILAQRQTRKQTPRDLLNWLRGARSHLGQALFLLETGAIQGRLDDATLKGLTEEFDTLVAMSLRLDATLGAELVARLDAAAEDD